MRRTSRGRTGSRRWSTRRVSGGRTAGWRYPPSGGSDSVLWDSYRTSFIANYAGTINGAAYKYQIPRGLLAGVAWQEVGGKPYWTDDAAYVLRSIHLYAGRPDDTSFGEMSMQVDTVARTLGYGDSIDEGERAAILTSLRDPDQSIEIAAMHLSQMRDELIGPGAPVTTDRIADLAAAYNGGEKEAQSTSGSAYEYGREVLAMQPRVVALLGR